MNFSKHTKNHGKRKNVRARMKKKAQMELLPKDNGDRNVGLEWGEGGGGVGFATIPLYGGVTL
jgi:hypothetical protein